MMRRLALATVALVLVGGACGKEPAATTTTETATTSGATSTTALASEPTASAIYIDGAEMLDEGQWEGAVAAFTEVIDLHPDDSYLFAAACLGRALALGELGRFEEAVADATTVIDLHLGDTEILGHAYRARAAGLSELGRFEEAIADATAVIDLRPDDTNAVVDAYVHRGWDLLNVGRFEEAIADATAVIDLQPDDADTLALAHLVRGGGLGELGQTDEAAADLRIVVELLPPGHELHQIAVEGLAELGFSEEVQDINAPGLYVAVSTPDEAVLQVVREAIEQRLASVLGDDAVSRCFVRGGRLIVRLPLDSDPLLPGRLVARGKVSFRPVLEVNVVSPVFLNGTLPLPEDLQATTTEPGPTTTITMPPEKPPNIDPETGLTIIVEVDEAAYTRSEDGLVYHVGPAFLTGADIIGALAMFTGASHSQSSWVVEPEFTPEGARKFEEGTATLSVYPAGDPRRQVAIVVDDVVFSAPQVSPEVPPGEGLDAGNVIITVGGGEDQQAEAEAMAAYLRYGALPEDLEIETWTVFPLD